MTGPRVEITKDWRFDDGAGLERAQQVAGAETPDRAAKVLDLSRRSGFVPEFVREHYDVLERLAGRETFDPRTFARESPLVADWLAKDPSRVALMGKDLTRMGFVERQVRTIAARRERGNRNVELLDIGESVLSGTVTPQQRERQARVEQEQRQPEDFGAEGLFEEAPGAAAEQVPILARLLKGAGAGAAIGGAVGATVAAVGGALGPQAGTPEELATVPAGIRIGMSLGGKTGAAYSAAVMEASGAVLDYERIEGMDVETARGAALIAGALAGSLELISLKQLAKVTPGLRNLSRGGVRSLLTNPTTRDLFIRIAKDIGVASATEGLTETLQSLITQGGGAIAAAATDGRLESDLAGVLGEVFGPEAMAQALAEGRAGAQASLVLSTVGGVGSFGTDIAAARRAERQAETIAKLADAGADAAATEAAPQEVSDLVTELRQAGVSGFSYDAQLWQGFWLATKDERGTVVDPAAVAAEVLGDATAYETALANGGTFEVPLGPWLTRFARNPAVRQWAVQNAKVGPGEMSAAEAVKAQEEQDAVLTELVDSMVEMKSEGAEVEAQATKLAERVEQQVRASGRPVREARRAGELWGQVYRTWAAESGTTADDLAAMFDRVQIGPQTTQVANAATLEQARIALAEPSHPVLRAVIAGLDDATKARVARTFRRVVSEEIGADNVVESAEDLTELLGIALEDEGLVRGTDNLDGTMTWVAATEPVVRGGKSLPREVPAPKRGRVALEQAARPSSADLEAFNAVEAHEMRADFPAMSVNEIASTVGGSVQDVERWLASPKPAMTRDLELRVAFAQAAFHGSPHIFDRFDLSKIGTGEGNQAFGFGLYLAEVEGTAEGYRRSLAGSEVLVDGVNVGRALDGTDEGNALQSILTFGFDEALARIERQVVAVEGSSGRGDPRVVSDLAQRLRAMAETIETFRGKTVERKELGALYRVEVPDEAVAKFLDWDKPLSEQSPEVRKAVQSVSRKAGLGKIDESMLGGRAYSGLAGNITGGQEAVSKALLAIGIPGIKYLDAGSRGQGEGSRNLVVFDESLIMITHRNGEPVTAAERADVLEQSTPQEGPRGRIRFDEARTKAHIELFSSADPSTFFHESAHLFLSMMGTLATREGASERIRADYAGALEWLGATPGTPLTVAQEEQWARGFEAYLMEGKAPSVSLRTLFASMARWLTDIYKSIRGLDVELTPDIRRIFDRMLATDAAIQEANESQVREPLFAEDALMPESERLQYAEALVAAQARATETLRTEVLSVIAREDKAWFKARRKEVEPIVREEVYADPAYRARSILQTGKLPDGTALPADDPLHQKLSKAGVVELIGQEGANALPRPVMYRVDGGLHPDVAAEALAFDNGMELLTALLGTQNIEREIKERAERRLLTEYGDPLTDGSLPARALNAIQTAEQDRVIQLELEELQRRDPAAFKGLLRKFGGRIPVTADVQRQAQAMLATRTIRSIRPIEFQWAEVKAAKQAIAAAVKGDWAAAADAKIRERLSLALTRAATDALKEVERQEDRFVRYFRPDDVLGKTRDLNLVNAARAILARVGMGRTQKPADEYLKAVRQYDPETADDLEALAESAVPPREDSRDLTLAEFREVAEQATALWDQSKRTRQMVIDGQKVDRTQVVDELGAELATMPDRMKGAGRMQAMMTGDTIRRRLIGVDAALRRVESWVDQMDGGNAQGKFRRYLWTPISEASARFRVGKRELTTAYLALVEPMRERFAIRGPIVATELNYTFKDRQELLGAFMHTGNASNFDKLLRGRGWDRGAWDTFERRLFAEGVLTSQEVTFLNGLWALFESVKPDAQRVHKEMLGYYFDEITAVPRETPGGRLTGGYVPAMADTMLVEDARIRADQREQEGVNPSSMFPSVSRGFTKGRVDEYARPLIMDLKLIRTHIDAVTKFIHLAQPVRDTGRLLIDRRFRAALSQVDPEMGTELVAWAQRAGSQAIETPSRGGGGKALDTIFRWLRTNSGLSIMALNVQNTLQQFTGLSIAAAKVEPKYLRNALWQVTRQPKQTAAAIARLSAFMATRVTASVMEVERRIDNLIANPTTYEQAKAFAKEHGYILQSTAQGLVDSVVWMGAFDQATAQGKTETEAVREADAAVRLTQGSFAAEDVSRFETGTPFVRAFTMFYSYFNMQANLLRSEFAQEMRKSGLRKGAGRLLYVYMLGFMVPAVLSRAIVEAMAGGPPDSDDDDSYLDEWMSVFFGSQVTTAFALVPGGNVVVQAGINQFNDKWYDDRVSVSPAVSTIESAGRGAKALLYDWWVEGEVQRRDIRDVLTLLSLASNLPFTALSRPGSYLFDVQQGDAEPTGPVDFTRGLLSGRPGGQPR